MAAGVFADFGDDGGRREGLPVGIAGAVPAFVMVADDFDGGVEVVVVFEQT